MNSNALFLLFIVVLHQQIGYTAELLILHGDNIFVQPTIQKNAPGLEFIIPSFQRMANIQTTHLLHHTNHNPATFFKDLQVPENINLHTYTKLQQFSLPLAPATTQLFVYIQAHGSDVDQGSLLQMYQGGFTDRLMFQLSSICGCHPCALNNNYFTMTDLQCLLREIFTTNSELKHMVIFFGSCFSYTLGTLLISEFDTVLLDKIDLFVMSGADKPYFDAVGYSHIGSSPPHQLFTVLSNEIFWVGNFMMDDLTTYTTNIQNDSFSDLLQQNHEISELAMTTIQHTAKLDWLHRSTVDLTPQIFNYTPTKFRHRMYLNVDFVTFTYELLWTEIDRMKNQIIEVANIDVGSVVVSLTLVCIADQSMKNILYIHVEVGRDIYDNESYHLTITNPLLGFISKHQTPYLFHAFADLVYNLI